MTDYSKDALYLNHDLNNQLGYALGYLELMLEKDESLKDNNFANKSLMGLLRARELSFELATKLSKNSHKDLVESKPGFELLPMGHHLIKNVKLGFDKLRKLYPIKINDTYDILEQNKHIYVNPKKLIRIRENIIANAVNAGATNIDINYSMKKHCMVITFIDNGSGMSQEELDKLFLKSHGDGVVHGLGTGSIFKVAEEHGFFVSYHSNKGKGTLVRGLVPYID